MPNTVKASGQIKCIIQDQARLNVKEPQRCPTPNNHQMVGLLAFMAIQ